MGSVSCGNLHIGIYYWISEKYKVDFSIHTQSGVGQIISSDTDWVVDDYGTLVSTKNKIHIWN